MHGAIYQDERRGQRLYPARRHRGAVRRKRRARSGPRAVRPAAVCRCGRSDARDAGGGRCGLPDAVLQFRRLARRNVRQRRTVHLPVRLCTRLCRPRTARGDDRRTCDRLAHHRRAVPHPAQHAVRCGAGKTAGRRRQDIPVQLRGAWKPRHPASGAGGPRAGKAERGRAPAAWPGAPVPSGAAKGRKRQLLRADRPG